jgi:hypothetical protein
MLKQIKSHDIVRSPQQQFKIKMQYPPINQNAEVNWGR